MGNNRLSEMVFSCLPNDIRSSDLRNLGKESWWEENEFLALAYSLRKYKRLNWNAYLANNPDVKAAGVDPVLHFLRHGVYEGRKLYSHHSFYEDPGADAPDISIVVANYNNAVFLNKSLNSVINQTHRNLEILFVDDGSSDESLAIAREFAQRDNRIKVLAHPANMGTHMTRKTGVAASTGKYIMFLDADDFFTPDACEKALEIIQKGHDIVVFEVNVIHHHPVAQEGGNRTYWFNRLKNGLYQGPNKISMSFTDNVLPNFMCNKIFERTFCQKCYAMMEEGSFCVLEDMYEFLIINYYARTIYKTDEILYNYSQSSGVSTVDGPINFIKALDSNISVIKPFYNFCKNNQLTTIYEFYKNFLFNVPLRSLEHISPEERLRVLRELSSYSSTSYILERLRSMYLKWPDSMADILTGLHVTSRPVQKIAIIANGLMDGFIHDFVSAVTTYCQGTADIVLVLINKSVRDDAFMDKMTIEYIPQSGDHPTNTGYVIALDKVINNHKPDVIFDFDCENLSFLWINLLCKIQDICMVACVKKDANVGLITRRRDYNHSTLLKVLKTVDKVLCANLNSEIYFRANGVDALKIDTYLDEEISDEPISISNENDIAIFTSFSEPEDRIMGTLAILGEVKKEVPNARNIYFIPSEVYQIPEFFTKKINELKLADSVIFIYGYGYRSLLPACKVVLSCRYININPNHFIVAQKMGLPIVMYRAPLDISKHNASIIQVDQGAYEVAAQKICELLQDSQYRARLSAIAKCKVEGFSTQVCANQFNQILHNLMNISELRYYDETDFWDELGWQFYYAQKKLPQLQDC